MKKRTFSWLLIAVLLISISGLPAALAEGEENYDVTVEDDVKTVVVYSSTYDATTYSSVAIDGMEASDAAQTEGSSVSVESGMPGSPVVEATVEGNVTSAEEGGWNTAVGATTRGEGNTATVTTTGDVEAVSSDGGATGISAESFVATEDSYISSSEGNTDYSTPVGTGGETSVEIGGSVRAEGGDYAASGIQASASGEGSTSTVTTTGNVEATSSDGTATGVSVTSDVAREYSNTYSSGGDTYFSEWTQTPVGTGGETTVEVGGNVRAEGTYSTSGVQANSTGEGSTTTVVTTGSVEATSSDSGATGVSASSNVATDYSYTSSSGEDSYSSTSSNIPSGSGGTTTVKVGGDVKAEGEGYGTSGIQARSSGEGSNTTVTTTGSVEARSSDGSTTGVSARSEVAYAYVSSSGEGSYEYSSTPSGSGGTTTVEVGGDVKADGTNSTSGVRATANGEGSTTTVTVDGTVDVKATADSNYSNTSGVFAQAIPATGYSSTGGPGERADGGNVSVTTGNITVTVEKLEIPASNNGSPSVPPEPNIEDLTDEEWEARYKSALDFRKNNYNEPDSYGYNGVSGVNASTVNYETKDNDSGKRTVAVTTGDVTVNAANIDARGVSADGKGTTVETGAVAVNANERSEGINASHSAEVTSDGKVTSSGDGVSVAKGGSVTVKGDVEAKDNAIAISLKNAEDEKSKVTIVGTVDSENQVISLDLRGIVPSAETRKEIQNTAVEAMEEAYNAAKESGKTNKEAYEASMGAFNTSEREAWKAVSEWANSEAGLEAIKNALPQIIVQSIPQKENVDLVLVTGLNEKNKAVISEEVLKQINYIVNTDGLDMTNVAIYGCDTKDGYLVAKENYTLTVKSIGNGSIAAVTAGQYANMVNNGDGSYTITVNRGGDLRLMANFIAGVVAEGGAGGASGKIYRDDGSYGGKVFLYVEENKLIADMTVLSDATILTSTLMRFVQRNGVDTFVALTANGSFTVAIDELVELLNGASCFTLVVKGDTMDLYGDWKPITTLSMMSST